MTTKKTTAQQMLAAWDKRQHTRNELAALLRVKRQTLWNWANGGSPAGYCAGRIERLYALLKDDAPLSKIKASLKRL